MFLNEKEEENPKGVYVIGGGGDSAGQIVLLKFRFIRRNVSSRTPAMTALVLRVPWYSGYFQNTWAAWSVWGDEWVEQTLENALREVNTEATAVLNKDREIQNWATSHQTQSISWEEQTQVVERSCSFSTAEFLTIWWNSCVCNMWLIFQHGFFIRQAFHIRLDKLWAAKCHNKNSCSSWRFYTIIEDSLLSRWLSVSHTGQNQLFQH